jgi:hypothetical protein
MTVREVEEYRELRATIRERGTARVWIAFLGVAIWAALSLLTVALIALPVATFIPLVALAAAFEAVLSLHIGAERVGRYVQVYFEDGGPGWETRIMEFGRSFPAGGSDPLFCTLFWLAAVLNVLPALAVGPVAAEWVAVALAHAAFILRVGIARRRSRGQRAADLDRFRQLKHGG